jgi:predicted SAM-dependent methyltransferase
MNKPKINVGCGSTPTPGWINFDNSPMVRVARYPSMVRALRLLGVLGDHQVQFADVIARMGIRWADAGRLPLSDGSITVVYSSHMLEHLDRTGAVRCLREFFRVLTPGGVLRLAVPDIERLACAYLSTRDADSFVESTLLSAPNPKTLAEKARLIAVGMRHHLWMYDGPSLVRLVETHGFEDARVMRSGETMIPDPGALDLRERESESVYVEAKKP